MDNRFSTIALLLERRSAKNKAKVRLRRLKAKEEKLERRRDAARDISYDHEHHPEGHLPGTEPKTKSTLDSDYFERRDVRGQMARDVEKKVHRKIMGHGKQKGTSHRIGVATAIRDR